MGGCKGSKVPAGKPQAVQIPKSPRRQGMADLTPKWVKKHADPEPVTPGAGDYEPRTSFTQARSPQTKIGSEPRFLDPKASPGPGSYQPEISPRGGIVRQNRRQAPRRVNNHNLGFAGSFPRFGRVNYLMK